MIHNQKSVRPKRREVMTGLGVAIASLLFALQLDAHPRRALPVAGEPSDATYGWELEFTNRVVSNASHGLLQAQANETNDAARDRWLEGIRSICRPARCRIREIENWVSWRKNNGEIVWSWEVESYRVVYPDGFWFQLSYDVGVVEVQMRPSTVAQLVAQRERIQSDLFDTAEQAHLRPRRNAETHLHTGAQSAFGMDLRQIRNYLVDGVNHPETALLFSGGLHNNPPLISLPERQFAIFERIIRDVDSGRIRDLQEFITRIRRDVYSVTLDPEMVSEWDPARKYQHWNLERMRGSVPLRERTIEDRSVPAPQNAADLVDLTALKDARVRFVKGQELIPLRPYRRRPTVVEQIQAFRSYLDEVGASFRVYRRFLHPHCARILTRS